MNFYMRKSWTEKFHLFENVEGEYAYTVCGQIHNMRALDTEIRIELPDEGVCGICRARQAERAA